ncbi:MAG: helicase-related protein [Syntrophomonas sp.]
MNIGDQVRCRAANEKGLGVIVGQQKLFQHAYIEVFFAGSGETISFPETELLAVQSPEEVVRQQYFSSASRFLLRLFNQQLQASYTEDGLQTAANFKILPLPHQLLAVKYVLDQPSPRVLIADEVGLGKTIEAALVYEELKARGMVERVLIVAPSGLCLQWQEELRQKFDEDFVIYDRETVQTLKQLHGQSTNIWKLKDRIITSIDFLKPKKMNEEIQETALRRRGWHNEHVTDAAAQAGFDLVIFDEAHKLTKDMRGEETARFKAGKALAETVPCFLLLSATPHQGDSVRFRYLLSLIDPHRFYKGSDLNPENVKAITVRNNKRAVVDFQGQRLFKQRITSLCKIRRNKAEDKIELQLYEAVSEYVNEFYNLAQQQNNHTMMFLLLLYQRMVSSSSQAIWKSLSNRLAILNEFRQTLEIGQNEGETAEIEVDEVQDMVAEAQIIYLENHQSADLLKNMHYLEMEIDLLKNLVDLARRASLGRNDAKLRTLLEIVDEFRIRENDPELKFIIFTEFVETQFYLNTCLRNLGYKTAMINGRMSAEEKQAAKEFFRAEALFLISTDAGGEGINLQFCRVLINYDLPWNPMRLEQRIGRIDRIGQKYDVKVVNFQLEDTVEQRVRTVIEDKLERIKMEFNNGEDKLADILSTLEEEFSFEQIYINAVQKRLHDAAQLEKLAEEIYQRAVDMIGKGELALPFSQLEDCYSVSAWELEKKGEETRQLLEGYLGLWVASLQEYKGRQGVYFFDDPVSGKHWKNVIFHQSQALEKEECDLLGPGHPYIMNVSGKVAQELYMDTSARMQVEEHKFAGETGVLFIYKLKLSNYVDRERLFIIPCFICSAGGHYHSRISKYFQDMPEHVRDLIEIEPDLDWDMLMEKGQINAERLAEAIYYEETLKLEEKIRKQEESRQSYFRARENALQRIAVDNIRNARLKELHEEMHVFQLQSRKRRQLIPSLNCEQIAYVEFV